tara:strand:- start:530 stop:763 length:234 start_codon:yes stop_codon:yes gene_type:complete
MIIIDLLIIGGFIGIGIIIASLIVKDVRKSLKVKKHIDSLPEKREDRPGVSISNKPPLTGKGQFDKQRTTYTEGDNT